MKRPLILLSLLVILPANAQEQSSGPLPSQPTDPPQNREARAVANLMLTEMKVETDGLSAEVGGRLPPDYPDHIADLAKVYEWCGKDPAQGKAVVKKALELFQLQRRSTKSCAQVQQIAAEASIRLQLLQVAQNMRIIALLEQIAIRKP